MKIKHLTKVALLALVVMLSSCGKYIERTFIGSMEATNKTQSELFIDFTIDGKDSTVTVQPEKYGFIKLFEHQGTVKENWPPQEWYEESTQTVRIYRKVEGEIQYLDRTYYSFDNVFVHPDNFMNYCDVVFEFDVTEDMFSE